MIEVYIGLGSNVGDRLDSLKRAVRLLSERMRLVKLSSIYESEPMYVKDQSWFLNCVAKFATDLSPEEVLHFLEDIEKKLGRVRTVRYGPRSIDLDILFYGNKIVNKDSLTIPHPLIRERRFVLAPMAELEPEFIHPVNGRSILSLLDDLKSAEQVRNVGALERK